VYSGGGPVIICIISPTKSSLCLGNQCCEKEKKKKKRIINIGEVNETSIFGGFWVSPTLNPASSK
jgi:hypothetical protein